MEAVHIREAFSLVVIPLLLIYPVWRVFVRAGLNRFHSLFLFVPWVGAIVVAAILAFSRWPAVEGGAAEPGIKA